MADQETVADLLRRIAKLMRASKRGEVQVYVRLPEGWAEFTLPEHRPSPLAGESLPRRPTIDEALEYAERNERAASADGECETASAYHIMADFLKNARFDTPKCSCDDMSPCLQHASEGLWMKPIIEAQDSIAILKKLGQDLLDRKLYRAGVVLDDREHEAIITVDTIGARLET